MPKSGPNPRKSHKGHGTGSPGPGLPEAFETFASAFELSGSAEQAIMAIGGEWGKPEAARWYVYVLIDPRDKSIFYVGKGSRTRLRQHSSWNNSRDHNGFKQGRIAAIKRAGLEIEPRVLGSFEDEGEALRVERLMIKRIRPWLTNIASGNVGARERNMAQGWALLDAMRPYENWAATLTPELEGPLVGVYGSAKAFYEEYKAIITRLATNPPPSKVTIKRDVGRVHSWA